MNKKKRVKKRARLIALLAALAALLAGGIGTGAAFAAMAATRNASSKAASSSSLPSKAKGSKAAETSSPRPRPSVLSSSSSNPLAFCQGGNASKYSYCQEETTDAFNSSAQVNYFTFAPSQGQYTQWAGKSIQASVTLQEGVQMPIALPIGLWNGSTFVNPNTLSPLTLSQYMLQGDYMGNIGVMSQSVGNHWYSFLGGVSYNGLTNDKMQSFIKNNSYRINKQTLGETINGNDLTLQSGSVQYTFQNLCNKSDLLSNPYFAAMASQSASQLSSTLNSMLFGPQGLYTGDEAYYGKDAPSGSPVAEDLSSLKSEGENLESTATVEEYQKGFEAYEQALKSAKSSADAKTAYLDAISGTDASKDQPLLCLAAWNQNVGYDTLPSTESFYTQGSNVSGDTGNMFDGTGSGPYSYAYWGAGPAYVGTSDPSDSTLTMTVSSTATDFLASSAIFGSAANSGGIQLNAIYYPGQASSFYSSSGAGVIIDIKPVYGPVVNPCPASEVKGSVLRGSDHKCGAPLELDGMGQYITFRSLGLTPNQVNPTSLPSGDSLSSSSPASYGLHFYAATQSGEPLKSVRMELYPDGNSSYDNNWRWSGWISTPIAPAVNSAPSGASSVWPDVGNTYWAGFYVPVPFTASSLSSQPGWFDFSGVAPGVYDAVILSGTTEGGKSVSYGSYYSHPTIQISATSFTSPETLSAVSDPCGFVDPSADEVVVGAANPSSSLTQGAVAPKGGTSDPYTATVGSSNPFTYEAEAYMPFDLSGQGGASSAPLTFTLSSLPQGEVVDKGSVKVNGKPLSSLGVTPASSSSGFSFTLSPSQISSVGSQGGTAAVTWQAYLSSSWSSPGNPEFEFSYKAYSASNSGDKAMGLTPEVETNGPASNSVPSSLTTSTPSSSSGLWFKDLNADGSASSGAEFSVQNASGLYLNEDKDSSGGFAGWTWSSKPEDFSYNPSGNADTGLFSFGGLQDGAYTVTLQQWPNSMQASCQAGASYSSECLPGQMVNETDDDDNTLEYPWAGKAESGYAGSFQVALSYSSPESMSTAADPAGLVDSSKDALYSLAPTLTGDASAFPDGYSKWLQDQGHLNSDKVSFASSYLLGSETIGVPFTGAWEGYLPMAVTSPDSGAGKLGLDTSMGVTLQGEEGVSLPGISASNVKVAGIPLSSIPGASLASVRTAADDWNAAESADLGAGDAYAITLPYQALEYLQQNGKNAEGEPLSSSSNRLILITYPQVLATNATNVGAAPSFFGANTCSWLTLGSRWWSQLASPDDWVSQKNGAPGPVNGAFYSWNGPSDNSLPSSLSPTDSSSSTGLWFKSLWYQTSTPATGAKFTVQTSSGQYLAPMESDGTFEGWKLQSSPYDFGERNSSAVFSFGGLANGTYTVTQVSPASKATPSALSFTATLSYSSSFVGNKSAFLDPSYSSPQSLKAVKDSLNLLDSSKDTVWAITVPSSLPFTGGKWVLVLSASAATLFIAAGAFFLLRKKRKRA